MKIKIRFNTEKDKTDSSLPPWRVLIDDIEHLAEHVIIQVPASTTHDEIQPGSMHISCAGAVSWHNIREPALFHRVLNGWGMVL